jgi:universal stress protein B
MWTVEGSSPRMDSPANRCVWWDIYYQRYRDHHDEEFIRRCERLRRQFMTSALCGLVVVSMIALMIWH